MRVPLDPGRSDPSWPKRLEVGCRAKRAVCAGRPVDFPAPLGDLLRCRFPASKMPFAGHGDCGGGRGTESGVRYRSPAQIASAGLMRAITVIRPVLVGATRCRARRGERRATSHQVHVALALTADLRGTRVHRAEREAPQCKVMKAGTLGASPLCNRVRISMADAIAQTM
jgi:hypothetical protein